MQRLFRSEHTKTRKFTPLLTLYQPTNLKRLFSTVLAHMSPEDGTGGESFGAKMTAVGALPRMDSQVLI